MSKMEDKEIIEGNKLIAGFMGGIKTPSPGYLKRDYFDLKDKPYQKWTNIYGGSYEETTLYWDEDLKYHSSWDWLMPVVEKIQSMDFKFVIGDVGRVKIFNNEYGWYNGHTTDPLIHCVWYGCVGFIKWHNETR